MHSFVTTPWLINQTIVSINNWIMVMIECWSQLQLTFKVWLLRAMATWLIIPSLPSEYEIE